jgi:hypothetical protein
VIRWVLGILIALMLFSAVTPWLQRLGIGRLPGDLRFRLFGREIFIPLTSTLLLSALASLLARLI